RFLPIQYSAGSTFACLWLVGLDVGKNTHGLIVSPRPKRAVRRFGRREKTARPTSAEHRIFGIEQKMATQACESLQESESSPESQSKPHGSLFSRAVRSSGWTIGGFGTSQAVRLAANLVLTRLLMPEMFGLMTLVSTFIAGL